MFVCKPVASYRLVTREDGRRLAWFVPGERMRLNLKRLGLLAGTCARAFAARARLTPQRVDLMLVVRSGPHTQQQIAHRLCVTRPVISRMLAALRELGLIRDARDPEDRRRRIPELTPEGRERLALCFPTPTTRGAQSTGEAEWLSAWRRNLAMLGVRVDSILRGRMPFFAGMAAWNGRHGSGLEPDFSWPPAWATHYGVAHLLPR